MAYKIVGVDEDSKFPPRVETRLNEEFLSTDIRENGELSESELDLRYLRNSRVAEGNAGQVLTKVSEADGDFQWVDAFGGNVDTSKRYTDWALTVEPSLFRAPGGTKLNIPTYQSPSGGETTHPSVVFIPNGWNGYRYWMAHTPYPGGNDSFENPSIVASDDGIAWVTPAGLTNPINLPNAGSYNSDTDLIIAPNNLLYLFWRTVNNGGSIETIYMSYSEDGVNWSSKKAIHETSFANERIVSPTFVYEDSGLTMWGIDISEPNNRRLVRKRADVANINAISHSSWSVATQCTLSYVQAGKQPWHVSLINVDGLYVGVVTDATTGQSGTNGDMFLITSHDGFDFESSTVPIMSRAQAGQYNAIYRGCIVPEINGSTFGFRVFYGAWQSGTTSVWNIYRTFAQAITAPNSSDQSGAVGLISGRFSAVSQNTIVRKSGIVVLSVNASMAIALNQGSSLVNIPVGYRNLTHNTWVYAWNPTTNAAVVVYYDRADHTIKIGGSIGATQGIAISMVWDQEG